MQAYQDLIELARICLGRARAAHSPEVAGKLRSMAKEYQERAAKLNRADDTPAPPIGTPALLTPGRHEGE